MSIQIRILRNPERAVNNAHGALWLDTASARAACNAIQPFAAQGIQLTCYVGTMAYDGSRDDGLLAVSGYCIVGDSEIPGNEE